MKRKNLFVSCGRALLFSLILLGFSINSSQAQVSYYLGVSGGPQFTTLTASRGNFSGRLNYYGGLTQEIQFGQMFSVQLDAFYSQKGADRDNSDSVITINPLAGEIYSNKLNIKRTETLTYADAHLLFKFNLPIGREKIIPYERPGKTTSITLFAGPYFGYLLNYSSAGYTDTQVVLITQHDSIIRTSRDTKEYDFNSYRTSKKADPVLGTDLGITVGAGMNFLVGERGMFTFDFRYSRGIVTIDNRAYSSYKLTFKGNDPTQPRITPVVSDVFNQAIALNVGFKYRLLGRGINRNF